MSTIPLPVLTKPPCGNLTREQLKDIPVWLTIYVFSTVDPKHNPSRSVVREFHPLKSVPPEYRHLIDVKFVVGVSSDPEVEAMLDKEEEEFGDLVRLQTLKYGENRDNGKAGRWIEWAGLHGRPSQWILKCDDDSMPVMPNFMPWLAAQDHTKPAYFGSGLRRNPFLRYYYCGLIYGYSWPVVRTIATAGIKDEDFDIDLWEDYAGGELMWMLPSKEGAPPYDENTAYDNLPMKYPDPRTGLVWLEVLDYMADEFAWWARPWWEMYAYHGMKTYESYRRRYEFMVSSFAEMGRKYEWKVPSKFRRYKNTCPDVTDDIRYI